MKLAILAVALTFSLPLAAQEHKPTPAAAPPALSTSDRVAITALEAQKLAAQKSWSDADQSEAAVVREFAAAHPGWIINAMGNWQVEAAHPSPPVKK